MCSPTRDLLARDEPPVENALQPHQQQQQQQPPPPPQPPPQLVVPPINPENDDSDEEMYEIGDVDEIGQMLDEDDEDNDEAGVPLTNGHAHHDDEDQANDDGDDDDDDSAIAIIPERDDAQLTFKEHKDAVYCIALHPNEDVAASGGKDETVHVWSTTDGHVLQTMTIHKDSVVGVEYSKDGKYLASADMSGDILVSKVRDDYKCSNVISTSNDINWMRWHPGTHVVIVGCQSGEVFVWRVPVGDCKILTGHNSPTETAELTTDAKCIVVGYRDGAIKLWDIRSTTCLQEIVRSRTSLGHTGNVTSISIYDGSFLSSAEDGKILIGSNRNGAIGNLIPTTDGRSVEIVAYCPYSPNVKIAASGTIDGVITIWDLARQAVRTRVLYRGYGITHMLWRPDQSLLCSTIGGTIECIDGLSGDHKFSLIGHTSSIYHMIYCRARNTLLTASLDGTVKLFVPPH